LAVLQILRFSKIFEFAKILLVLLFENLATAGRHFAVDFRF
jgi:hypothetical protein